MKHVRGDLIALLAVVALALVGPREATADPCKADGQTCRTNQSCCGTNGHNGVCAKASSKKFGTCCTPTTCTAQGAECGMILDGSCPDMLVCGTCPDDEICTAAHVCETTTTTTTTTTSTTTTTQCTAPDPCDVSTCGPTPDACGATVACPCAQCQFECTDHLQHRSPACAAPAACTADSCLLDCATACSAIDRVCFPETVQCVSCTP